MRKTTNIKAITPAILVPTIAAIYPSDSGDGEIKVAIVGFVTSLIDVVKDVTEKVLASTLAAIYSSDLEDGEIKLAIVEFEAPLIDVVKDVNEKIVVGLEVSVESGSGTVFVLMFPALET